MNGLLDIWDDWKNQSGWFKDSSSNLESMAKGSDTINRNQINRGRNIGVTSDPMKNAINQSGKTEISRQNVDQVLQKRGLNQRSLILDPKNASAKINAANKEQWVGDGPWKMRSGTDSKFHTNQAEQMSWWQKFADKFNIDFDKAQASWKDKGGFEGLMANPAFTMGLAFLQAGAEGKTLGAGALDNVMKSAGISSHYKKILEDRKLEPIQATSGDIAEVKDMLKSINIEEGNWLENLIGGPQSGAKYEAAVEEIAVQFQKEIRQKQKALKEAGKSQIIRRTDQLKILQKLVDSNIVQKKESFLSKIGITSGTLQMNLPTRAKGGPVQAGKPYVVGEKGPEVIIPKSDGNVLANDDSQIFAMLLASNPQLQNVSRQRAERILRSRFPEYFEV